ncbi:MULTISPECIES: DUF1489 family protein [Sphingomonas]|uniref:DUF1489 family protein n=1 Tax=Sphingomonas TaxID=13687 RepID=UPI000DEFBDCD|nr:MULTISPECIES: DUF1489 family protein [Sphingomonas]
MPNLHLTKVAVGCRDVASLERRIAGRAADGEVRVVTRMRPKRMAELIGGSLYWIVKHRLVACQTILRFDDRKDGRLDIVCSDALLAIPPTTKRAHQGWRYLESEAAPKPGDHDDSGLGLLPPLLYGKLSALALI